MNKSGLYYGMLCLLFLACHKNDEPDIPSGNSITSLHLSLADESGWDSGRNWQEGDQAGVFVTIPGQQPLENRPSGNTCCLYDGEKWIPANSLEWLPGGKNEVVVYTPYRSNIPDFHEFIFAVAEDQQTYVNLKNSDLLYGKAEAVGTAGNTSAEVSLKHRLVRLDVNIEYSDELDKTHNVEFCKIRAIPELRMNLMTGMIAEAEGELREITAFQQLPVSGKFSCTYTVILPPQRIHSSRSFIEIGLAGQQYALEADTTLTGGKVYTMNVRVGREKMILSGCYVADWEAGLLEGRVGENIEYRQGEVVTWQLGRKEHSVPLVFTGEGFTAAHMLKGGYFDQCLDKAIEALFRVEPYKTYREYFTIYKMAAISEEEGADNYTTGEQKKTFFDAGWSDGYKDMQCRGDVFGFVSENCPDIIAGKRTIDEVAIIVIINDNRYGGICILSARGRAYCMIPVVYGGEAIRWGEYYPGYGGCVGDWTNLVVHEGGGHCFGRLTDEYYNINETYPYNYIAGHSFAVPYGLNVSARQDRVSWEHFIGRPEYPDVGKYEGGNYYLHGVWRPEGISCMVDNRYYYNAPSRELIVKRIKELAGETYSFDEFLQYDSDMEIQHLQKAGAAVACPGGPLPPPIIIP